jgi:dnd system-associated protein 4
VGNAHPLVFGIANYPLSTNLPVSEHRIRVARDKAELVKSLIASAENNSPFQTYADVILFAAVLGAKQKQRTPLGEISKKEPGPISIEIFIARGYDPVMKLIAIAATENINVILPVGGASTVSNRAEFEQQRIQIFEEYANGGLDILDRELRGAVDYTERILLMLSVAASRQTSIQQRQSAEPISPNLGGEDPTATDSIEFDLRKFLG